MEINDTINCYINCSFYYYFNKDNNRQCRTDQLCPKEYSILSKNKKECLKNDFNYLIHNITQQKISNNNYDTIIKIIDSIFMSKNFDTSKLEEGQNEIINIDKIKIKIIFKTLNDSKNYKIYNYTKLDLGGCETLLRIHHNISENEMLYLKQTEIEQEGLKVKKIEYDIYYRTSNFCLKKLDVTVCGNTKLTLTVPVKISGSLDKYNISSGYYSDICYTTTSDSGTDIIIKDRQNDFKLGKKVVCQEDCDFTSYNYSTSEASCSCYAKKSSSSYNDMKIKLDNIYKRFTDIIINMLSYFI